MHVLFESCRLYSIITHASCVLSRLVMSTASQVCTARKPPACNACPLAPHCRYHKGGGSHDGSSNSSISGSDVAVAAKDAVSTTAAAASLGAAKGRRKTPTKGKAKAKQASALQPEALELKAEPPSAPGKGRGKRLRQDDISSANVQEGEALSSDTKLDW